MEKLKIISFSATRQFQMETWLLVKFLPPCKHIKACRSSWFYCLYGRNQSIFSIHSVLSPGSIHPLLDVPSTSAASSFQLRVSKAWFLDSCSSQKFVRCSEGLSSQLLSDPYSLQMCWKLVIKCVWCSVKAMAAVALTVNVKERGWGKQMQIIKSKCKPFFWINSIFLAGVREWQSWI